MSGPFFFLSSQAPTYNLGVGMMFFCIGIQVLSIVGLWVLLWRRNVNRRSMTGNGESELSEGYEMGFRDMTDKENIHFRTALRIGLGSIDARHSPLGGMNKAEFKYT
ncbi:hypothetical protein LTR85_006995 [Meristemomyces frigidus]|nr:hypothetical protein LTR85_006995 [Meristemomyces frigidus]